MPSKVISDQLSAQALVRMRSGTGRLIELTWLAAIIMIPLIFQVIVWFPLIPGLSGLKQYSFIQPKSYLLHATALIILSLWVFDISLAWAQTKKGTNPFSEFKGWLTASLRDPVRWALLFTALFLIGQIVSVLISPSPLISFIGRNQNEPGGDFYTQLSTLIIFAAIAVRVRRRQQVERIFGALIVSGLVATLYGFAQLFGIDPFGFSADRIYSTLGNPIFYASFLLLSSLVTFTWGWLQWDRKQTPLSAWIFGGSVILTGLQAASILLTASRGPVVGLTSGLFILVFLVIFYRQSGTQKRVAISALLISIITWLVLWLSGGDIGGPVFIAGYSIVTLANLGVIYWKWRLKNHSALFPGGVVLVAQNVIFFANGSSGFIEDYMFTLFLFIALGLLLLWNGAETNRSSSRNSKRETNKWGSLKLNLSNDRNLIVVGSVGVILALMLLINSLVISINTDTTSQGRIGSDIVLSSPDDDIYTALNNASSRRLNIWDGAWQLIQTRESAIDESEGLMAVRHIFGNSQEMYYIGYPLTAFPTEVFEISGHAHSQLLQIWVELGIWGLVSFLGILVSVFVAIIMTLTRLNSDTGADRNLLIIICFGLLAIFGARFIEQIPGVGRIVDSFIFALSLGLGLAVYRISRMVPGSADEVIDTDIKTRTVQSSQRLKRKGGQRRRGSGANGWTQAVWGPFKARIHIPISILLIMVAGSMWLFVQYDGSIVANSSKATSYARLLSSNVSAVSVENYETHAFRGQPLMEIYDELYEIALAQPYEEAYAVDYARDISMIAREYQTSGQNDAALELTNRGIEVLENVLEVSPFAVNPLVLLVNLYTTAYDISEDQIYKTRVLETGAQIELLLSRFANSLSELAVSYFRIGEYEAAARVASNSIDIGNASPGTYFSRGVAEASINSAAGLPMTNAINSVSIALVIQNVLNPQFAVQSRFLGNILRNTDDPVLQEAGLRLTALQGDIDAVPRGTESSQAPKSQRQLIKGQVLMLISQNDLIKDPSPPFNWENYNFVERLERSSYYEPTDIYSQEASVVLRDYFESEGNAEVAMCYTNRATVQQNLLNGDPGISEDDVRALDCREN